MVNAERSRRDVCHMQKLLTALIGPAIAALVLAAQPGVAEAQSRIKDIVSIEGVRSNQLVGYGLVVGLNGTGDSVRKRQRWFLQGGGSGEEQRDRERNEGRRKERGPGHWPRRVR